jgi:hypothetical protein
VKGEVLEYSLLVPERWEEARELLATFGQALPSKENSMLSVAEDEGKLRAILCYHPVMHGEPFWVDERFRGSVDITRLQNSLTSQLPKGLEYYAFTPSRKMRWIAGTCGMKPMPWDVWKGTV